MEHNKQLETALYENFARMAFEAAAPVHEREFFIDNLLVRIH